MAHVRLRNFVNGKHIDPCEGGYSHVVDPSTGEAYAAAPVSSAADVDEAMRAAQAAFETWRDTTPAERSLALLKFADAVERRAAELTEAECRNTGKPLAIASTDEVPPSVDQLRFFAGAARVLEGRSAGEYLRDHTSMIRREPVGVCAQVTPWNYPLMMAVWKIGPALAAGNTVVLKPSDTTPVSTLLLAEIAAEFFPPGVFNVICGDRVTGRAMVVHPVPAMVSITGSVRAGTEVARAAADGLKRVHLELGGKAPVIVFDDADVEAAAKGIAAAGYYNAGQDCTAAARVIAGPGIAADLADALAERARATKTGGLDVPDADYGPLNNPGQLARVSGFLDRVPAHATVAAGGHAVGGPGSCSSRPWCPGWRRTTRWCRTRSSARSSPCSGSPPRTRRCGWPTACSTASARASGPGTTAARCGCARRLDFGVVWVNTHIPFTAEMPHGGFKHSGYGKDLSMYGFEDYTRVKHVMSYLG